MPDCPCLSAPESIAFNTIAKDQVVGREEGLAIILRGCRASFGEVFNQALDHTIAPGGGAYEVLIAE
jgi:hypothetical protein